MTCPLCRTSGARGTDPDGQKPHPLQHLALQTCTDVPPVQDFGGSWANLTAKSGGAVSAFWDF